MSAGCVAVPAGAGNGADVLKHWFNHYDEIADDMADKIKIAGSEITADELDGIISELAAVASALRMAGAE